MSIQAGYTVRVPAKMRVSCLIAVTIKVIMGCYEGREYILLVPSLMILGSGITCGVMTYASATAIAIAEAQDRGASMQKVVHSCSSLKADKTICIIAHSMHQLDDPPNRPSWPLAHATGHGTLLHIGIEGASNSSA
eukprot:scaffold78314_cov26-Prasinocladus_malaysianus.AAC.1